MTPSNCLIRFLTLSLPFQIREVQVRSYHNSVVTSHHLQNPVFLDACRVLFRFLASKSAICSLSHVISIGEVQEFDHMHRLLLAFWNLKSAMGLSLVVDPQDYDFRPSLQQCMRNPKFLFPYHAENHPRRAHSIYMRTNAGDPSQLASQLSCEVA